MLPFLDYGKHEFATNAERLKAHVVAENNKSPRLFVRGVSIVRADTNTTTKVKQIMTCGLKEVRAEINRLTTWAKHFQI